MNDFRKKILKIDKPRVHRITNSLGVYSAYKWLRKNKWLDIGYISEHDYYTIIREVNKELARIFLTTSSIKLPERMGIIELRKYPTKINIINGKIKTNLPINWDATLKLWAEDKEAYNNRMLIRSEEKEVYKVIYNKNKAIYNNKAFYFFELNRQLKIKIKQQIKSGHLDAYMLCGKI